MYSRKGFDSSTAFSSSPNLLRYHGRHLRAFLPFRLFFVLGREMVAGIEAKYPASSVQQWVTYWDHQVKSAAQRFLKCFRTRYRTTNLFF